MANASPADVLSNWSHLIEYLEASPLGFFNSVEKNLAKRGVPDIETSRVDHREGGILSAKREYLRIKRGNLAFDVCAAPYGTGFFVSWWLTRLREVNVAAIIAACALYFVFTIMLMSDFGTTGGVFVSILLMPFALLALVAFSYFGVVSDDYVTAIPVIGFLYVKFIQPVTFYSLDTTAMFRSATHAAVLEAMDELTSAKGIRALSEHERKPALRTFAAGA